MLVMHFSASWPTVIGTDTPPLAIPSSVMVAPLLPCFDGLRPHTEPDSIVLTLLVVTEMLK